MASSTHRAAVVTKYAEDKESIPGAIEYQADAKAPSASSLKCCQVLVAVRAASLNPVDYKVALGNMDMVPSMKKPPFVPGFDLAGVVEAVGSGVKRLKKGDRVWGMNHFSAQGTLAELVVVDEAALGLKPPGLTFAEAASMPLVCLTSLQALELARVGAGSRVLVLGGSGGTGTAGVQIAAALGAAEVVATCSAANDELVRGLGAARTIDYRGEQPWWEAVEGLDAVYDTVGGHEAWEHCPQVLRDGRGTGGFVTIAGDRQDRVTFGRIASTVASVTNRKFWSLFGAPKYAYFSCDNKRADQLDRLAAWVAEGKLRPVVDRVYPLEEAAAAYAHVFGGHSRGKVVVAITADAAEAKE